MLETNKSHFLTKQSIDSLYTTVSHTLPSEAQTHRIFPWIHFPSRNVSCQIAKHRIFLYVNVNKRPIFECSLINFHFCNPENAKALHALTTAYGHLPDLFKSLYNHAWVFISQHWSCSYQFCLSWQEINLSATGHYSKLPVGLPLLISILIVTVDNGSWSGGNIRRNQWKGCDPLPNFTQLMRLDSIAINEPLP